MPLRCCSVFVAGITVLLSLTVFMLLVAEIMPATSDSVPLIGEQASGPQKDMGLESAQDDLAQAQNGIVLQGPEELQSPFSALRR